MRPSFQNAPIIFNTNRVSFVQCLGSTPIMPVKHLYSIVCRAEKKSVKENNAELNKPRQAAKPPSPIRTAKLASPRIATILPTILASPSSTLRASTSQCRWQSWPPQTASLRLANNLDCMLLRERGLPLYVLCDRWTLWI